MAQEKRYSVIESDLDFFRKFKLATVEAGTTIAEVVREQTRRWLQEFEANKQEQNQDQQEQSS